MDARLTKAGNSRVRRREGYSTIPRQDKQWRERRVKETNTKAKRVYTSPPHPHKGLRRCMNPNWTNLLTRVFIYVKKATPEGETHTHAWNRSTATSSWLRPVLREWALGIAQTHFLRLCSHGIERNFARLKIWPDTSFTRDRSILLFCSHGILNG